MVNTVWVGRGSGSMTTFLDTEITDDFTTGKITMSRHYSKYFIYVNTMR